MDDELPVRLIPHDPKDADVAQTTSELLSYVYEKALYYAIMNGVHAEEAVKRVLEIDDEPLQ